MGEWIWERRRKYARRWAIVFACAINLWPALASADKTTANSGVASQPNTGAARGTDTDNQAAQQADEEVEEIIVTGSRIKRSGTFPSSAPVEVLNSKQIAASGARNLGDIIQNLTTAPGSGIQGMGGGAADGRVGTATANLRGLGIGATLVLINGRRFVSSSAGADAEDFSDLNIIPLVAVRRIEILKGGASAVYGADAVAGVVNVITHKDFDGLRVFVNGEAADDFDDYRGYTIGGTFGAHNDRATVLLSAEWDLHTELPTNERDWSKDGAHVLPLGFPGNFRKGQEILPDPDCALAPNSLLTDVAGNPMCAFSDRNFVTIIPAMQRGTVFASAEYNLTHHTKALAEANFAFMSGDQVQRPFFLLPSFSVTIPADHVDNPFNEELRYSGRVAGEAHGRVGYEYSTFRMVAGLGGDFEDVAASTMFEDWEWEVFVTYGRSHTQGVVPENVKPAFQTAVNSCSDPTNLSGCFNPFYSSELGTGTPNSEAVLNSIQTDHISDRTNGMRTYNAGLTGSLFELPGGPAGIAFGGQVRQEWSISQATHEATTNQLGTILGATNYEVQRRVYAGFLELRLPALPGLEIQGAGRVERHTNIAETAVNPTVGLTFSPGRTFGEGATPSLLQRLTLRGHVAKAFRAPTMSQAANIKRVTPRQVRLPDGTSLYLPIESSGNPNLKSENALAWSAGLDWTLLDEISVEGEYWSYTYENRVAIEDENGKLQAWADSNAATNSCNTSDPAVVVDADAGCVPTQIRVQTFNSPGTVATNGLDFALTFRLSGTTFGGSANDWGTFSAGVRGTYTLSYTLPRSTLTASLIDAGEFECDGDSDNADCEVVGNRNSTNVAPPLPRWQARFPVSWTLGGHAASLSVQYTSPIDNDKDPGATIDAMTTLNLQYAYTITNWVGRSLNMRIGVINLFNQAPPAVPTDLYGYEPLLHDPRGRMAYAKLTSEF